MRVRLTFTDSATAGEKNAAANAARQAIREFVADIQPGGKLVINSLVQVILGSHRVIQDVGSPGEPFDQILVWRNTTTSDSRFSRTLRQNLSIQIDEELLVEYSINNPVEVIEA